MALFIFHNTVKLCVAHGLDPREVNVLAHLLDCLNKHYPRHGSTLHCSEHMEELQTKSGATICEEPMIAIRSTSDHMDTINFLFQLPGHQGDGHYCQHYQPGEEAFKALSLVPIKTKWVSVISCYDSNDGKIDFDLLKNDSDFEPSACV